MAASHSGVTSNVMQPLYFITAHSKFTTMTAREELKMLKEELYQLITSKQEDVTRSLTSILESHSDDYDDYDDEDTREEYDNHYTSSQQFFADRSDYANELLRSGKICEIQAAEIRAGA